MIRRILFILPILALFAVTAVVFLVAHAPRTWAAHWSAPRAVALSTGEDEFGAVPDGARGWDLLWVDSDNQSLDYTVAADGRRLTSVLDRGEVSQPYLMRTGNTRFGVWVHDYNGSTTLFGALIRPGMPPKIVRLAAGQAPLEHPQAFRSRDGAWVIFSWQARGNYELYLQHVPFATLQASTPMRLSRAEYYSFYPRAVTLRDGSIAMVHLENCCKGKIWQVMFDRFDAHGRRLRPEQKLYDVVSFSDQNVIPSEWAEDIRLDARGNVWGAFGGDNGIWVFEAAPDGRLIQRPHLIEYDSGLDSHASLTLTPDGGTLFWDQRYDLGTYIAEQQFDRSMRLVGGPERVMYESGSQARPHADDSNGDVRVVWQTVSKSLTTTYEESDYRQHVEPTWAQRLGLGLTNPLEELAVLIVTALCLAIILTTTNILDVLILAGLGTLLVWLLGNRRGRWLAYACILTAGLYALFVAPGGPVFFLDTMPSMGLSARPFGLAAAAGALFFVVWAGAIACRRIDAIYRAGIMAFLGMYFFAFVETIVFVQQRIGYI